MQRRQANYWQLAQNRRTYKIWPLTTQPPRLRHRDRRGRGCRPPHYPLRLDPTVHAAIVRWADDDLRSVNAQIEFALRDALRRAGRLPEPTPPPTETPPED